MYDYEKIKFSSEQKNRLREVLGKEWFQDLNDKINMYDEDATIEEKIEHIKKYIMHYCQAPSEDTKEAINNFFDLLQHYEIKKYREPIREDDGVINILYSGFNSGNAFYTGKLKIPRVGNGKGCFTEGIYITTEGKEYIKKLTMDAAGKMGDIEHHTQSRYNGVIANQIFEFFGEKSAKYLPATKNPPYYFVISENFLNEKQELITFDDFYLDKPEKEYTKQSEVLKLIEKNICIRYKNYMNENDFNKLVKKLSLQYCKQAFIKRLIGLRDEKLENIGIVLTSTGNELDIPELDISPAFDLDMSFDFADEVEMKQFKTDNGKTDIKSLLEEIKNIEGFKEFITEAISKMENEEEVIDYIINKSYEFSGAKYFKVKENIENYKNYLKNKFKETKLAFKDLYIREKGEEENDSRAILD